MGVDSVAMYYPNGDDAKWDADYYVNTYLPKLVDAYGGEERAATRRGAPAASVPRAAASLP